MTGGDDDGMTLADDLRLSPEAVMRCGDVRDHCALVSSPPPVPLPTRSPGGPAQMSLCQSRRGDTPRWPRTMATRRYEVAALHRVQSADGESCSPLAPFDFCRTSSWVVGVVAGSFAGASAPCRRSPVCGAKRLAGDADVNASRSPADTSPSIAGRSRPPAVVSPRRPLHGVGQGACSCSARWGG